MILVVVSQRRQCRVVFGAEGEALLVGHGPAVVHPARVVQEGPAGLALSTQQTENCEYCYNQGRPFGDCLLISALLHRASSAAGHTVEQ